MTDNEPPMNIVFTRSAQVYHPTVIHIDENIYSCLQSFLARVLMQYLQNNYCLGRKTPFVSKATRNFFSQNFTKAQNFCLSQTFLQKLKSEN